MAHSPPLFTHLPEQSSGNSYFFPLFYTEWPWNASLLQRALHSSPGPHSKRFLWHLHSYLRLKDFHEWAPQGRFSTSNVRRVEGVKVRWGVGLSESKGIKAAGGIAYHLLMNEWMIILPSSFPSELNYLNVVVYWGHLARGNQWRRTIIFEYMAQSIIQKWLRTMV